MAPVVKRLGKFGFLSSEANGYRSREEVTVEAPGADVTLEAGTVMGRITSSGKYVRVDPDVSPTDGSETAAGILCEEVTGAADVQATVIVRDAEVVLSKLIFSAASPSNATDETAELASVGIIAR
jgi:hypothetical protein